MIRTSLITKLHVKYGNPKCECGESLELLKVPNIFYGTVKRVHCPSCLPVHEPGEDR